MDDESGGRPRHQQSISTLNRLGLTINRHAGGVLPTRVMAGIQASLLLLVLVGCDVPNWWGHSQQAHDHLEIVAGHPEWPPEILGAVASGVICAGMTPDMVRAAWGRPTRISSSGSGLHQRDTWHYAGRQHNANVMGGQRGGAQPSEERTVAFTKGWVVGWTD
jgi:hypothetical protein